MWGGGGPVVSITEPPKHGLVDNHVFGVEWPLFVRCVIIRGCAGQNHEKSAFIVTFVLL